MTQRPLTIGEQQTLAQILRAQNPLVYSFDLAPPSVNMEVNTMTAELSEMVQAGRKAAEKYWLTHQSRNTDDLVLCILWAALDVLERGQQTDSDPQTG